MKAKKLSLVLSSSLALSLLTTFASDATAGTDTANLDVSASVSANCTITTSALAFGSYDPVSAHASSPLDGTGAVNVTCTSGSSGAITLGQGANSDTGSTDDAPLRRMTDGSTSFLSYSLFQDASRTEIWGNTSGTGVTHVGTGTENAITIYGRVSAGQNVPAGSYSDTVVATVTF